MDRMAKTITILAALLFVWLMIAGIWKSYELIAPHKPTVQPAQQSNNDAVVVSAKDTSTIQVDLGTGRITSGGQSITAYPDGQAMIVSSLTQDAENLRAKLRQAKDDLAKARTYEDSTRIYRTLYLGMKDLTDMLNIATVIRRDIWGFCFKPGIAVAYGYEPKDDHWGLDPGLRLKYFWYRNATLSAMATQRAGYPAMIGYHLFRNAEIVAGPGITWDKNLSLKLGIAGDL